MNQRPRSAYLHIPFCHRRCFYCDFAVVPLGDRANGENGPGSSSIKSYLELLHREIELVGNAYPLSTIYIGGGTPSLLTPLQISSLLEHLREIFGFQDGSEITLEVDPASFSKNSLDSFVDIGINRLSLGGQSFNDEILLKIGRRHNAKDLLDACSWINEIFKSGKILSWNLDLIQNLPGHDLEFWEEQLLQAIRTSAPHFSIYDLIIEKGTVFDWKNRRGEINLPNNDLSAEVSRLTTSILNEAGFSRYEISNYALPGHTSRHNRVYWSGSGWWGFGMGATSAPWGTRLARPRTRKDYKKWVESQEINGLDSSLMVENFQPIPLDDQLIVGLRRREGVDLESVGLDWGWDENQCKKYMNFLISRWDDFLARGFLRKVGNRICLSNPEGMEISNKIFVEVILWWESLPDHAVVPPTF